jgi:hypothetical protein
MTTASENETLTRVGPGTPMGDFMRLFWIPAAMASELVVDGDPVRLKLLGEELIAFRDTQGRVGVMDHRCPHRCASLFFGRNEEGGIRCDYHGNAGWLDLVSQAGAEMDDTKRRAIVRRLFDEVDRANYILPLTMGPKYFIHTKDVKVEPSGGVFFSYGIRPADLSWR